MRAYLVLDFSIHDLEQFKQYILEIPGFIEKHLGRYIVSAPKSKMKPPQE